MGNENWTLTLNVAGMQKFVPGSGMDRVPTGPYVCLVEKTEQVEKKGGDGCDNIVFNCLVTEPSQKGKHLRFYMPIDPNVGDGMVGKKWHNLLVTVAKNAEAVDKGGITLRPELFKGKTIYLYVQEVPGKTKDAKGRERDNLPNIDPIEKSDYDKFKAEGGPGQGAGATATGSQTPAGSMEVTGGAPAVPNGAATTPHTAAAVTLE